MIIIPANTLSSGGYDVANSLMFDGVDSYLNITSGSSPTSTQKFTVSFWLKRSELGREQHIFGGVSAAQCYFISDDRLRFADTTSGTNYYTTQVFRDVSAWYNIVIAVDTTLGAAGDRARIYVNGSEVTAFDTETNATQNNNTDYNIGSTAYVIGRYNPSQSQNYYYSGYMAEYVFIDGQQLAPTSFGEFDDDSPTIWKPIDVSGLTFGANGYYLDFADSGDLGDDESGNGNDFSENSIAATDQCVDSPTNNFCTFTTTHPSATSFTITEGGTRVSKSGSGNVALTGSSLMPTAGKWYFEALINEAGNGDRTRVGVVNYQTVKDYTGVINTPSQVLAGCTTSCKAAKHFEGDGSGSGSVTEYTASGDFADDDVVNFAMDLDNKAIYIGRNNTWHTQTASSGGDPTSGASKTGAITTDTTIMNGEPMSIMFGHSAGVSDGSDISFNFGNPAYALTSAANDENGYGNFEYAPPSGFLALCTKNLGSDGG